MSRVRSPLSPRDITRICWRAMLVRCMNPKHRAYRYYGARGITVCERWRSLDAFIEDMGLRPGREYSIDRKDSSLGYGPENCSWATHQEQQRHRLRLLTVDGITLPIGEWARRAGIRKNTLFARLRRGMSDRLAVGQLSKPTACSNGHSYSAGDVRERRLADGRIWRYCRACARDSQRVRRAAARIT